MTIISRLQIRRRLFTAETKATIFHLIQKESCPSLQECSPVATPAATARPTTITGRTMRTTFSRRGSSLKRRSHIHILLKKNYSTKLFFKPVFRRIFKPSDNPAILTKPQPSLITISRNMFNNPTR